MTALKALIFTAVIAHYQGGAIQPDNQVAMADINVPPVQERGVASWYGDGNWHGEITANGEKFRPNDFTCAHRDLPFNTMILVENVENGRQAWCRVNDRGPYGIIERNGKLQVQMERPQGERWRVLDLSVGTARKLDMLESGLGRVRLRYWIPHPTSRIQMATYTPPARPVVR